jgi:uncharacterized membrane protein YhaH (DUF805 family)
MKPLDPTAIDPHRPWIKDARDNPHEMNWLQTFFNPLGASSKLHFSRAWTFMFLGRVLLFIVPVFAVSIASLAGADLSAAWNPVKALVLPIPALLVPFFAFTLLTELTSWVAHVRRFHETHKSTLWAMIVLIPLMLGLAGFSAGVSAVSQAPKMMERAALEAADHQQAVTAGEEGVQAETAAPEAADKAPPARHGPKGGKAPSLRDAAIGTGMFFGIIAWAAFSLVVMFWTLLYVARMPNGGVGRFKTGSDIAQGEEEKILPAYAIS